MSHTVSRRTFSTGTLAALLGGGLLTLPSGRTLVAQESTPAVSLPSPMLDITVTAEGFEGMPEEIPAGRYQITVTLAEGIEEASAAFLQPPAGMSMEAFLQEVGLGGAPAADASPAADPMAGGLPPVVYEAVFAGGASVIQGTGGKAILDLGPGEWMLWTGDPTAPQQAFFTVTGELPADLPEPESDLSVNLVDYGIILEGALTAGEHLLRIENQGAEPHFVEILKGPDDMTDEQVEQVLMAEMGGGSPAALPFNPETDLSFVLFTADQSSGVVNWVPVTLEAGTYAALCFFPTASDGAPHAFHGMHTVFTVS